MGIMLSKAAFIWSVNKSTNNSTVKQQLWIISTTEQNSFLFVYDLKPNFVLEEFLIINVDFFFFQ